MGTGSRHSKNAGTMGSESLTYHEKKALGFGTITERLGKETVKAFDACALSLTHATDPVVTPEGVLYDREHILRCLLRQKKDIARKLRAWEDQLARDAGEADAKAAEAREEAVERFHRAANQAIAADPPGGSDGADADVSDDDDESDARRASVSAAQVRAATDEKARRAKELNAFWLPSKTPDAAIRLDRKPETHTICPTTGKKLRMKDLTDVKWTKLPPSAAEDAASRWRYMCPVTRETLTDASRVVVLKPSGAAVSEEAYDKVLAREKEWDGRRIKGVVKLQRGGSGFAASGTQVESKKAFALGAGSGLADSRGAPSKFDSGSTDEGGVEEERARRARAGARAVTYHATSISLGPKKTARLVSRLLTPPVSAIASLATRSLSRPSLPRRSSSLAERVSLARCRPPALPPLRVPPVPVAYVAAESGRSPSSARAPLPPSSPRLRSS